MPGAVVVSNRYYCQPINRGKPWDAGKITGNPAPHDHDSTRAASGSTLAAAFIKNKVIMNVNPPRFIGDFAAVFQFERTNHLLARSATILLHSSDICGI